MVSISSMANGKEERVTFANCKNPIFTDYYNIQWEWSKMQVAPR